MGEFDSSLKRVQPIFKALYKKDPSGASWLQPLLKMVKREGYPKPLKITANLGDLTQKPLFEFPVDPPKSYLKWLIKYPEKLKRPPRAMCEKWSEHTQKMRQALLAGDKELQAKAISDLEKCSSLPKSSWWRFEGVTYVDCALLTNSTVVFIEGKWTEVGASKEVLWYDKRNQVLRNLDCAVTYAQQKGLQHYFVIMVVEKDLLDQNPARREEIEAIMSPEIIKGSLPHLTDDERKEVLPHYLGTTSWEEIIEHFGLEQEVILQRIKQ
jgi:hypothetical protein